MNMPNTSSSNDINPILEKVGQHEPGYSLDRQFYTSAEVYERDLRNLWCESWLWAGHTNQLSKVGDYFLFSFGDESIIVVRDEQEGIVAHLNVCRHRGSRICLHESGNTRTFVCPYHGWTYQLDGELRAARSMGDSFDVSDYGLQSVHVLVHHGLIFVCLADMPPDFDRALEVLNPHIAPFDIAGAKIAHRIVYPVAANWKLALENYLARNQSNGLNADPLGADIYHRRYPLYPGQDMSLAVKAERRWPHYWVICVPVIEELPIFKSARSISFWPTPIM